MLRPRKTYLWKHFRTCTFLCFCILYLICICYFCTCSWEFRNWKKARAWREKETYLWKHFCAPQFVIFLFHVYFVLVAFVFVFGSFATGRWGPDIFVKTFLRTFICNLGQHRHHDSILRVQKSVSLTKIPFHNHSPEVRYNLLCEIGLVKFCPFSGQLFHCGCKFSR